MELNKDNEITVDTSLRITSLRFLLILFVMIKHNALVKDLFSGGYPFFEYRIETYIKEFFSFIIGELSVPVFFIFSAFLLALSRKSYLVKLKSRFLSIFLPYTLWTVIHFFAKIILNIILGSAPVFFFSEWTFKDYFLQFWGYYNYYFPLPFVGSFWFLRDLMILIVISPILVFFTKKIPLFTFTLICFAFIFQYRLPLIACRSLFFFEVGLFFAIYKINFLSISDKIRWRDALILFVSGTILFFLQSDEKKLAVEGSFSYFLFISAGVVSLFKTSKYILENKKLFQVTLKLAPLTFFVYACHTPILVELVKKLTLKLKLPSLLQFFTACILDIGLSFLFAYFIKRYIPVLFSVLNGGKRKK